MKSSAETRRYNLSRWVAKYGSPRKEKSYFSQLLSGIAPFGEKAAKRLEEEYKMGAGYLDTPITTEIVGIENNKNQKSDEHEILRYHDVGGSMGLGILLKDQPGEITSIKATDEWINKNVPANTGRENLCIVTGFGDSMIGMFNPGDPLLVDRGVVKCDHDGVYFFRVGDEGYIKTLQRIPGRGIVVISENKKYESWVITKDMDFQVLAKVLTVWESKKY